jgi:ubiquinone/menaquinone biosynthesis C-methylase UbiE
MRMPAATDPNRVAQELFDELPARYDRLAEVLSFGQNGRWRRTMVDHIIPTHPARVLDVASGTAGVAIQLARRSAATTVIGVDLTEQMLRRGSHNVADAGLSDRIGLTVGQAEHLPFPDAAFDAMTFTYLLRYVADPQATLRELARVVRPGGAVASLEFYVPPSVRPAGCGRRHRRTGVVRGRSVPRTEHLQSLPALPAVVDGRGVGEGGLRRHRRSNHESRRWTGHVGHPGRWLSANRARRITPPPTPEAGGIGGPCCIRRTPRGTCPTW